MQKPFIMVAPNGARRGKADHPALPITIDDIVATATACHSAGADALHLHVRDELGAHSLDAGRYLETLAALASALPDMPVQITTEAAGVFDVATQMKCLQDVKPRWASVSIREIGRSPELADHLYGACAENSTRVQHIIYNTDDIALLADWQAQGIVRPDQSEVIFVLGRYTQGQRSSPSDLEPFLKQWHSAASWMVCAFGQQEHQCLTQAARRGGTLRVGFENNLLDAQGQPFADNAASVTALCKMLAETA